MSKQYRAKYYNQAEHFQNLPEGTQALLIDEYTTAKLPATQINQMCDGTYQYPTKNGTAMTLDRPIILICGNASIESVYPKAHQFIRARFIEIELDPRGTLPVTATRSSPRRRDIELKDIKDQETLEANKENHDFNAWRET